MHMAHGVTDIAGFVKLVTLSGQGQSKSTNAQMIDPNDSSFATTGPRVARRHADVPLYGHNSCIFGRRANVYW